MKNVIVRRFQESDAEEVMQIFDVYGLVPSMEQREKSLEYLRRAAREPEWYAHHLVAELDGRVAGRVVLEAPYPPYSELINLYVHPDHQGRGVGSSLVQACIETASTHKCFVMSTMTDPIGNLPAHRLYSKFGFRPGILGDPSVERGHMWLFRFSQESCTSEFLRRHPFAEPFTSRSKICFHDRMLYQMSWRDAQTEEKMDLYLEGQPSQTPEGTMPRIAGFSYEEQDLRLEAIVKEQSKIIKRGGTSGFTVSFWNLGSRTMQIVLSASVPQGIELTPEPQTLSPLEVNPRSEETIQFKIAHPSSCKLPDFTTFPTMLATCFFMVGALEHPLSASAGFEK